MRIQRSLFRTGLRGLRLAGLTGALALVAGAGMRVYAAGPGQNDAATPAPAVAQAETTPAAASGVAGAAASAVAGDTAAQPTAAFNAKAAKGKKVKQKKVKPPKLIAMHIQEGTLTVDGWTAKARLNYDISDLKYIYVWAPGIGTIVASNEKFPMAKEQPGAFNLNNLTLDAGGHSIQISSENRLLKNKKPISAWVYVDTAYHRNSGYPEMGYGSLKTAPYAWPGATPVPLDKTGSVDAPALPAGLRPNLAKPSCTPGAADASQSGSNACPAPAPASKPAAVPPVPLPGYRSGTTTAQVSEAR